MRTIRVLAVDDSAVMRWVLREAFATEQQIELAGAASGGRAALAQVEELAPDAVVLDIEMPDMDGVAVVRELRRRYPRLPVIMFSAVSERGAGLAIEALAAGANDCIAKPKNAYGAADAAERVREQLVPRIKALVLRESGSATPVVHSSRAAVRVDFAHVKAVVIGTSTGGPSALETVLAVLPKDFPVPIAIVQHMPPIFTNFLAERLSKTSTLRVSEAKGGERLQAGNAWVARGNFHLLLRRTGSGVFTALTQSDPENSCRPSVDVLFRSAATVFGGNLLAVVMTGMGQDGLEGCHAVKRAGGRVLVQDEASSVVWGMPGFVARAGLADEVVPLNEIGTRIVQTVMRQRLQAAQPERPAWATSCL